ncbi:MAG: hypothetical protein RPU73_03800 [Candidatus Sedimenticola sp. (ex Thyasira tokunagai)]
MTKQKIAIESSIELNTPERAKELRKKDELNEEEWGYLKEREKAMKKELEEWEKNWKIDRETHEKMRKSTLLHLAVIWLLYFFFVPKNISEVFGSLLFPTLYWAGGMIIGIELVIIVCIGLLSSLWISRKKIMGTTTN